MNKQIPATTRIARLSLALLAGLAMVLGPLGVLPAHAQADTITTNVTIPFSNTIISCATGGTGEIVYLSGDYHVLVHTTLDSAGGYHAKWHSNPQGVSGVGLTTGAKYRATGVAQWEENGKVGYELTYLNSFRLIGQGRGNNFMVSGVLHYTVNANGVVTVWVETFHIECK